jgi:hypothetical protein
MDVVRRFVLLLLVAGGLVVAAPGAAHACSCVTADPKEFVAWADAVVWAEVAETQVPADGMGSAHYLLDVQRVYKGDVTERARVDSAASGAACGLEGITAGRRYAFFLQGDGSPWTANLCGGTGFVTEQDRLERAVAATEAGTPAGTAPAPGGPEQLPMSVYSYAGIGVGGLVALAAGLVAWRRRGASGAA